MAASKRKKPWMTGTSSGHITNLKQSIFVFWYLWVNRTEPFPSVNVPNRQISFCLSCSFCDKSRQQQHKHTDKKQPLKKRFIYNETLFIFSAHFELFKFWRAFFELFKFGALFFELFKFGALLGYFVARRYLHSRRRRSRRCCRCQIPAGVWDRWQWNHECDGRQVWEIRLYHFSFFFWLHEIVQGYHEFKCFFFWFKQVPDWGPEQREPN